MKRLTPFLTILIENNDPPFYVVDAAQRLCAFAGSETDAKIIIAWMAGIVRHWNMVGEQEQPPINPTEVTEELDALLATPPLTDDHPH